MPEQEMTKYGVSCRCNDPSYTPRDEELVKQADGSMSCPSCGQTFMLRGSKKGDECCEEEKGSTEEQKA